MLKAKNYIKKAAVIAQDKIVEAGSGIKKEAEKKMAKKVCGACGKELGIIGKIKLRDGIICQECLQKAGYLKEMSGETVSLSVLQIQREIEEKERNAGIVTNFVPTYAPAEYAKFDDNSRQMVLAKRRYNLNTYYDYTLFSYDQIVDYELLEDGNGIASGGVGRAVVGGLLFGGVGAVVGSTTRSQKATIESLKIKITLKDSILPAFYITLISYETKKSSKLYKQIMKIAQDILAKLQLIVDSLQTSSSEVEVKSTPVFDVTDEIRKFKSLLDDGIITQEEFDAKKNMLLGL